MVRSFSGRFVRIGTEARVNVGREIQEREDALAHASEGCEMTAPTAAQDLPDAGDGGHVQGIIRPLAGHDIRRYRYAQRIQGRHHDLDLGQVWAMVFAMSKLKQPSSVTVQCPLAVVLSRRTQADSRS